eukprot:218274_1
MFASFLKSNKTLICIGIVSILYVLWRFYRSYQQIPKEEKSNKKYEQNNVNDDTEQETVDIKPEIKSEVHKHKGHLSNGNPSRNKWNSDEMSTQLTQVTPQKNNDDMTANDELDEFIAFIYEISGSISFTEFCVNWLVSQQYDWQSLLCDLSAIKVEQSNVYRFFKQHQRQNLFELVYKKIYERYQNITEQQQSTNNETVYMRTLFITNSVSTF